MNSQKPNSRTSKYVREINNKKYEYYQVLFKKSDGGKERYKFAAKQMGISLNALIITALEEKITRENINVPTIPDSSDSDTLS